MHSTHASSAARKLTSAALSGFVKDVHDLTKPGMKLALADPSAAIGKLQASCDAAPANAKPDFCSYLKVATSAMNLLFDLHQTVDGLREVELAGGKIGTTKKP